MQYAIHIRENDILLWMNEIQNDITIKDVLKTLIYIFFWNRKIE
jgi:hypothetical protein